GLPTDDPAREDIDEERDVDDARPGHDVGEVRYPKLVGPIGCEVAIDQVARPLSLPVGDRGASSLAANDAAQAVLGHQPLDCAPGDLEPVALELPEHLPSSIQASALLIDPVDLNQDLLVAERPGGRITPPSQTRPN